MAIWDVFRNKPILKEKGAYMTNVSNKNIFEQLAEVEQNKIKFPKELGEEHPFNFKICEDWYENYGLVQAIVDKYLDYLVGQGFYIECEDDRAKEILEMFMRDNQFYSVLRKWAKEGLVKGSGFMEIIENKNEFDSSFKGKKKKYKGITLKTISSNHMYVVRDKHGKITGFNQYTGEFSNKIFEKSKVIPFEPNEIADVYFGQIGDKPYGTGIIHPMCSYVENLIKSDKDAHTLQGKKANAPLDVTVGTPEEPASQVDIDAVANKMQVMTNKTEWVHGHTMKMGTIDYGQIGEKFTTLMDHDLSMIYKSAQIPEILMGSDRGWSGSSDVQKDAFQRRISSFQEEIEKVIEEKIFKRVLQLNGFDVYVEFQWGDPSDTDRREEIKLLIELLKIPFLEPTLNIRLQQKLADLYDLKEEDTETMEEEKEKELEQPQPTVPGQNGGANGRAPNQTQKPEPKAEPKPEKKEIIEPVEIKEEPKIEVPEHKEEIIEFKDYELREWLGFNYQEYLNSILKVVELDSFDDLLASNSLERKAGYLTDKQTEKLRNIFKTSFERGESIRSIAKKIKSDVKLKSLLKYNDKGLELDKEGNPIVQINKDYRSEMIARTETTRLANLGALDNYKDNGVQKVRWIAALSDRTCEECQELNGQIFEITDPTLPPVHVDCRCTIAPITELE
jgi:SPP1 gp7 family putative phage head morphogenesis protein